MRLRWKLKPKETGLRAIGAGHRSSWLHDGTKHYATVSALRQRHAVTGWFWVAGWGSGVPHENTCNDPVPTAEEAKAQALAYVKQHLAQGESKGGGNG